MRLENGTDNLLVNNALVCVKNENHEWLQNIKYMLDLNGFGNRWNNPRVAHNIYIDHFVVAFRKRLEDQYIQFWTNKCKTSKLYNNLSFLKSSYSASVYVHKSKTLLLDLSLLNLELACQNWNFTVEPDFHNSQICTNCDKNVNETVEHVLLECHNYDTLSTVFLLIWKIHWLIIKVATEKN